MKYWLLTTEYPPAHGGGISTYCYFTAQMLTRAGYTVTVFVNDDSIPDFSISNTGNTRVIRFNSDRDNLRHCLGPMAKLSYAFAGIVRKTIEEEGKPSLIEAQDYLGIAYYLTQFKHAGYPFLGSVPIVITIHSPAFVYLLYNRVPVYKFPDFWTGEMEKQALVAADMLISPTHFMLEEVETHVRLSDRKTVVIPNPYQITVRQCTTFTRNKIVYYGKLSVQKGSFELLSYFKDLWDDGFPHPLHIIGGTDIVFHPEMKTMGALVQEKYGDYLNRGLLKLHGKIKPSDIEAQLHDAQVVIVPSIVDNMPYTVMESMSLGKIVLASIQGGQKEMLEDGVSGFLFDHNQPGSFKTKLLSILALSDAEIGKIGSIARQHIAAEYSFEAAGSKKQQVLEAVNNTPAVNKGFPFLYQEPIQLIQSSAGIPNLLSVVIPFYNMGKYIDECVQSVFHSTHKEIELLIINDGSSDQASIEKINMLRGEKNITVINQPNKGLAAARNNGALLAKGAFLAFLDADDYVAPDYYERAIRALKLHDNIFFVGAWVKYFENSSEIWPAITPQPPYALVHNPVNSSSLVYKREAFLAAGLNDKQAEYGLEDYESVIHMLASGFNGVVLPEVLFHYRVRTGSMFRNITNEKLLFSHKYIAEKHRAYYSKYALQIIHLLNANGPGYLYDNPGFPVQVSAKTYKENILVAGMKKIIKRNEPLKRLALKILKLRSRL